MHVPFLNVTLEPGKKLLGRAGIKVRVALVSGVVLLIGGLLTPRTAPTALAVPEERAAPLIDAQVLQRRVATPLLRGLEEVASSTRQYGVVILSPRGVRPASVGDYSTLDADVTVPAGLGVLVAQQGYVLTHEAALAGRESVRVETATDETVDAHLVAHEPSTGLVLLQIPPPNVPAIPEFSARAETGALVVATGRSGPATVAVPTFIASAGARAYLLSNVGEAIPAGAPIYNADRQLLAVAAGPGGLRRAFPADEAVARLVAALEAGRGRAPSIGITLQSVEGFPEAAFGDAGALVSAVVPGGPSDVAGVEPGDVVIGIGPEPVQTVDSAIAAIGRLSISAERALHLLRDGRPDTRTVTVSSAFAVGVLARQAPQPARPPGVEAGSVVDAPRLDAAGIDPTARIVRVDGQPVATLAQARRALDRSAERPVILRVQDGTEQAFVVLPGREPAP